MLIFHYISQKKLRSLKPEDKIKSILDLIRNNNIIIIEGRLKSTEEAQLIRETMSVLSNDVQKFNGIEIGTLFSSEEDDSIRMKLAKILIGDKTGLTIIGPAKIVKELRQHPEKIELHFQKNFKK